MPHPPTVKPTWRRVAALGAAALLLAACGDSAGSSADSGESAAPDASQVTGGALTVVATHTILGDLVRGVAGGDAAVEVLMAPGQDPHGYAPSAQQAQALREADLVVANGLQFEEGLLDALGAAEEDGVEVLRVAELVDPLAYDEGGEHADEHAGEHADEHGDEHADEHDEHGAFDPHFWHDPRRAATAAREIARHLAEADDQLDDQVWLDRGEAFAAQLEAAYDEISATLSGVPAQCRKLVTNHDSFGYLAATYDFEVIGSVVPGTTTQVDPSAQEFAALADLIRDEGVPAIFAESVQSTRLAAALAEEVGSQVLVVELFSDSLGAPGSDGDTYLGMLEVNAQRIADALGSC